MSHNTPVADTGRVVFPVRTEGGIEQIQQAQGVTKLVRHGAHSLGTGLGSLRDAADSLAVFVSSKGDKFAIGGSIENFGDEMSEACIPRGIIGDIV